MVGSRGKRVGGGLRHTLPATKGHADQNLAKARQLLQTAQVSPESVTFIAATGYAAHAGINAPHAITASTVAAVWPKGTARIVDGRPHGSRRF